MTALALLMLAHALVQPADASQGIIEYRQYWMASAHRHVRAMEALVDGRASLPPEHLVDHAMALNALARRLPELFPDGSHGRDSEASPDIWQNRSGFAAAAQSLLQRSEALLTATRNARAADAVRTALDAAVQACKDCHRTFREH